VPPFDAVPLEDDALDDAFEDGLAVAACAIAAPLPTSAPDTASATTILLSRFFIPITSSPHRPVHRRRLGVGGETAGGEVETSGDYPEGRGGR
jgi:hypothetical protein